MGVEGEQRRGSGPSPKQNNNNREWTQEPGWPGAWAMSRWNSQQSGVCIWQTSALTLLRILVASLLSARCRPRPPPPQGQPGLHGALSRGSCPGLEPQAREAGDKKSWPNLAISDPMAHVLKGGLALPRVFTLLQDPLQGLGEGVVLT